MTRLNRIFLGLLILSSGLWTGCTPKKIEYPGSIFLLADSTIYEISTDGAAAARPDVQRAALSPDGQVLLTAEEGGTFFLNLRTNEAKKIAEQPARSLGWNADGSRFVVVSDPLTNQLLVGDRLGKTQLIYRGSRLLSSGAAEAGEAEAAAAEPIAAEISGCLFLDPSTLVFSAHEGVLSPTPEGRDITANRAFWVDLNEEEPELLHLKFPAGERWIFIDIDGETGAVLAIIEKKASGEFQPYLSRGFKTWEELSFEAPVPGTFIRCANGDYSILFQPRTGLISGIAVLPDKKKYKASFFRYDPDSRQAQTGPDLGWGDNIVRPVFHPDGGQAAVLIYTGKKDRRLIVVDLETGTATTVWTLPVPENEVPNPNDRILAWMR